MLQAPDSDIWALAKLSGLTIVTTDADFFEMATTLGPPPKVIWLRRWTHPTRDAEAILRREAIRIAEFASNTDAAFLVLDKL
jgi:predicted nuclease of predicted toxin-antitoxin system